jgi:hypothetical protein
MTGCGAEPAGSEGRLTAAPSPSVAGSATGASTREPSATASTAATPSPAAPIASPGSSTAALGAWNAVLDEGEPGRVNRLYDMARLGERIVAVGESVHTTVIHSGPYERSALLWLSDDGGATWRPIGDDPIFATAGLRRIVVVGDEAYIFGELGSPVWRSLDGEHWERAQLPGFDADGWSMAAIAGGPLGWVMVGERTTIDPYHNARQIWFSADWQRWELTRNEPGPAAAGAPAGEESYQDVGAGPEGFVVAGRLSLVGETQPRMLASADGRTWHVAPEQPALELGMEPLSVAPLAGDWIAAGAVPDGDRHAPALWHSPNGLDWSLTTRLVDPQARERFGFAHDLVSVADRLFLRTSLVDLATELEAGVWTSLDGVNWELLELDAAASVSAALWLGDRWLLAGYISGAESRAAIWSSAGG